MDPNKKIARIAGLLYLILALTGFFGIMYVPSKVIVWSDAGATLNNVQTFETLFRVGILSQLTCQVLFVFLVLELKKLLKSVNANLASQMVMLVIVAVPIAFLNMLNLFAIVILNDPRIAQTITADQLNALATLFLQLYGYGITVVQIFWGLWLIPFGLLVYRSVFIPRIFGILLVVGGIGYVVTSITDIVYPAYTTTIAPIATTPSGLAEFAIIFWLLIKGVRTEKIERIEVPV
jgi:hypothetical protein